MSTHDAAEIATAREAIVSALNEEYAKHTRDPFDPYKFGSEVAALVNAFAALTIIEKAGDQSSHLGEASRSDD